MKQPSPQRQPSSNAAESAPSRRTLLAGLGAAGAAGAAVAALPLVKQAAGPAAAEVLAAAPAAGGGYQLSAHVKRYYQTAKV